MWDSGLGTRACGNCWGGTFSTEGIVCKKPMKAWLSHSGPERSPMGLCTSEQSGGGKGQQCRQGPDHVGLYKL